MAQSRCFQIHASDNVATMRDYSGPGPVQVMGQSTIASRIVVSEEGLTITLAPGSPREQADEVTRRLVEAGIGVHGLRLVHASLEDWFLSVTSRLGEDQ